MIIHRLSLELWYLCREHIQTHIYPLPLPKLLLAENCVIIVIWRKWTERKLRGNNNSASYYPSCELSARWQAFPLFGSSHQVDGSFFLFSFFRPPTKKKKKMKGSLLLWKPERTICLKKNQKKRQRRRKKQWWRRWARSLKRNCSSHLWWERWLQGGGLNQWANEERRQRGTILSSAWLCGEKCHQRTTELSGSLESCRDEECWG